MDVDIGSGLTTVKTGDGDFRLDFAEAARQINRIARECKAAQLEDYEYLDKFREWVEKEAGVKLRLGQARALIKAVDESFREGDGRAAPPPA
jgi:hypothetical protein